MKLEFTKMHGNGNDFIILDLRKRRLNSLSKVVKKLSDRRFGIGFDQAMVIKSSRKADFRMDIFNYDGSKVEMCGNGIRCVARYIWSRGLSKKKVLNIETLAGIIKPEKASGGLVKVDMGRPVLEGRDIPTTKKGTIIDHPLKVKGRTFPITCVSMGNPHGVIFVKDVDAYPVTEYGPLLEKAKFFPKKANIEFIEVLNKKTLKMRVWERGTGETLACGTGACAAHVAAFLKGYTGRKSKVKLKGGDLDIEYTKEGKVFMTGPAAEVFTGTIEV